MQRQQTQFLFLNVGHFLDHFFVLIFATAAALQLSSEWGMGYAELIPYATPGLVAFGLFSIPAGWLADKWSREGMMTIFFIGIGISSVLSSLARTPVEIALGLTLIGAFAAIYHPVGLAMVVQGRRQMGLPLAINGIFGNMGVASAALLTGFLIDSHGWRSAFLIPGIFTIGLGMVYALFEFGGGVHRDKAAHNKTTRDRSVGKAPISLPRNSLRRIFAIIFITTALGGLIFQSTTFALPKVMDERLTGLAESATLVGWYTFIVFTVAAFAQLVAGHLVDKHSVRGVFAWISLLQVLFFAAMIQTTDYAALVIATAFMLVVFGVIPVKDTLIGRMARSEWRSRAYATSYIINFSVSGLAVPLIAWIHHAWGFDALFGALAVTALLITFGALLLPRGEPALQPASAPTSG